LVLHFAADTSKICSMSIAPFPLEKVFGSRTRVKIISLFTTGISRPYYVREIARAVNERLNAVRRELDILERIGMLTSYESKRRKYYAVQQHFIILQELTAIMQKIGPKVDDGLFKNIDKLGNIVFACATGMLTGRQDAPTDLLLIGDISEQKLKIFAARIEHQLGQELSYTPITLNEYQYRRNFNDMFLQQIFSGPYTVIINNLDQQLQPDKTHQQRVTSFQEV